MDKDGSWELNQLDLAGADKVTLSGLEYDQGLGILPGWRNNRTAKSSLTKTGKWE
jgi:hypothetical protein